MPDALDVPVLIVGGGPVGLSASILLSRLGVHSLLVEKHQDTVPFVKAISISTRTMELFGQWGIVEEVEAAGIPREHSLAIYVGETLTSRDFRRNPTWQPSGHSPASPYLCPQDALEPVLRAHAERLGPDQVRFGTELLGLTQDGQGVSAQLVDRGSGARLRVRAAYLVGADGARSTVRSALGIDLLGQAAIAHWANIFFEADLRPHLADRISGLFVIHNAEVTGLFITSDNARRWRLMALYHPGQGESIHDFTHERCAELVRAGIGRADIPVRIERVWPWRPARSWPPSSGTVACSSPVTLPTCAHPGVGSA